MQRSNSVVIRYPNDMSREIKTIVPTTCPSCKKDIFVEFIMQATALGEVFTMDMLNEAKADLLKRIENMDLSKQRKKETEEWILSDETLFAPGEATTIMRSIVQEQDK